MKMHVKWYGSSQIYHCGFCDYSSNDSVHGEKHRKFHHFTSSVAEENQGYEFDMCKEIGIEKVVFLDEDEVVHDKIVHDKIEVVKIPKKSESKRSKTMNSKLYGNWELYYKFSNSKHKCTAGCEYGSKWLKNTQRHELKHGAGSEFTCSLCDFTANSHGRITYHENSCHSKPKVVANDSSGADKLNLENPAESVLTGESENVKHNSLVIFRSRKNVKYHNSKLYKLLKCSRIRSSVKKNLLKTMLKI